MGAAYLQPYLEAIEAAVGGGGSASTVNVTTTPLDNGQTYTGTYEDVSAYDGLIAYAATDQDGVLYVDFSPDGTNTDSTLTFQHRTSKINPPHRLTVTRPYARIRFENNSGSNQTYLRAGALLGVKNPLSVPLSGTIAPTADAILTRVYPEFLDVQRGLLQGVSRLAKFGRNPDIDTATDPEDVWGAGGDYTGFPTGSAETIEVFSSSTDDDGSPVGTGARTVRLIGLDANYAEQTVDVTMNGTTAVTTAETWLRLNRVYVLTAGSTGSNVGTITARHSSTTANVFAVMPATEGQTTIAAWTVPADKTLYLDRMVISAARANGSAGSAAFAMITRDNNASNPSWRVRRTFEVGSNGSVSVLDMGLALTEKTDIKIRVTNVSDNDTRASAEFGGYILDDA